MATGFNRNHMINFEGGAIPEEYRTAYVVDRVNTTGTVWLGLTVGCARCHDHKFDPITQRDYYRLYAFFNNVPENGLDGSRPATPPPMVKVPTAATKSNWPSSRNAELPTRALARGKAARRPHSQRWKNRAEVDARPAACRLPAGGHYPLDERRGEEPSATTADATARRLDPRQASHAHARRIAGPELRRPGSIDLGDRSRFRAMISRLPSGPGSIRRRNDGHAVSSRMDEARRPRLGSASRVGTCTSDLATGDNDLTASNTKQRLMPNEPGSTCSSPTTARASRGREALRRRRAGRLDFSPTS